MKNQIKIIRQKSLFDDETSDDIYFKEEMKRIREKEIREKEKAYLENYAKSIQVPLSEADDHIKNSIKAYENMIIESFGKYIFKN